MNLQDKRTGKIISENVAEFTIADNEYLSKWQDGCRHDSGSSLILASMASEKYCPKIIRVELGNGYLLEIDENSDFDKLQKAIGEHHKALKANST